MLLKNTFLYLPAQLLPPLAQFIAAVAWTFWLAPKDYGLLTLMMATQELVYVITLSWWSHYTMRYVGEYRREKRERAFQGMENGVVVLAMLAQASAALAIAWLLGFAADPVLVAAAAAFIVFRSLSTHLAERARAIGRIDIYSVFQIGGIAGGMLLAHLLIAGVAATPAMGLTGMAAASALATVAGWRLLRLEKSPPSFARETVRSALSYGGVLMISGAIAWLSMNGIRLVVEAIEGTVALGLMAVGWGLGQRLVSVVAMMVTAAAYPLALACWQAGEREEALRHLARNGLLLGGLLLPSAIGIALVAPALVELMVAPDYRAMTIAVLPIAAAAAAIRNFRVHFTDQVLLLEERADLCFVLNIVEVIATAAGCLIGISVNGVVGACWGVLAGAATGALLGFVWAIGRFGLVPPWGGLARIALGSIAMALAVIALGQQAGVAGLLRATVMGGAVYALALVLLFPQDVRRLAGKLGRAG
jgi:O-antigen/teichoic acid export membrane protein